MRTGRDRLVRAGHAHEARLYRWQARVQAGVVLATAVVFAGVVEQVLTPGGGSWGAGLLASLALAGAGVGAVYFTVEALYGQTLRVISPGDQVRGWVVVLHTVSVVGVLLAAMVLTWLVEGDRIAPLTALLGFAGWCLLGVMVSLAARQHVLHPDGSWQRPEPPQLPLPDAHEREQCPHCGDLARIDARRCEWCGHHLPTGWHRRYR